MVNYDRIVDVDIDYYFDIRDHYVSNREKKRITISNDRKNRYISIISNCYTTSINANNKLTVKNIKFILNEFRRRRKRKTNRDLLAKVYYDIAFINYKYYQNKFIECTLIDTKLYFQKSIQQFSFKEDISIAKEINYVLDSVCDLYLKSQID